jgi:leucyl aminopeptidase
MLPTSTDLTLTVKSKIPARLDAVVAFITEGAADAGVNVLAREDHRAIGRLLSAGVVRGRAREIAFDLIENEDESKRRRVYVVGLGPAEKVSAEIIRQSAGALARALRKHRMHRVAIKLPQVESVNAAATTEAIVTGLALARFRFGEYKGTARKADADEKDDDRPLEASILCEEGNLGEIRTAADRARIIADGQNFARTIASRPGNNINPPTLAKVAQQLAREVGLGIRVLDEKQMAKLNMGGILAVGSGSAHPPRMIVLQHRPGGIQASRSRAKAGRKRPVLLVVGKAITFDTGGISIKPAEKMGEMIFDKCGGMAVLGLMYAVAKLKLPIDVVGILSSAENMPGSRAYRPGDILRMHNGVTVEVTNTDAEGRLVLGDALAWGIETFKPTAVVDLATLTGGVVVALGHTMTGVMCNSDALMSELQRSADAAGEKIWRLPLGDDQRELLKSDPADIVNSAGRWASPLQGGAFLSYFVPRDDSVPWAHLDIAGVADTDKELPYYARGATGWGVRTLVEWVTSRVQRVAKHATPRPAGG